MRARACGCFLLVVVQVGPLWRVALILGLTGDLGTKHILANSVRCGNQQSTISVCLALSGVYILL